MVALIVEDGTGIYTANAYVGRGFVRNYLTRRNRATAWLAATDEERDAAIIAATDYIDRRFGPRFFGFKEFRNLDVASHNILDFATNAQNNDEIVIGSVTYTFVVAAGAPYEVTIGADAAESATNLTAAINLTPGGAYGAGTLVHPDVTAEVLDSGSDIYVEAKTFGTDIDGTIATTSDDPNLTWAFSSLQGALDGVEQFLEFPRLNLRTRSGTLVDGIPEKLRQATAEYAERALAAELLPDPEVNASGKVVVAKREKLGPIEEETRYAEGAQLAQKLRPYPAADRLLSEYIGSGGGVYR